MAPTPSQFKQLLLVDPTNLLSSLLQSSIATSSPPLLLKTHALLLTTTSASSSRFLHNRLVDAYSKCGSLSDARKVFDRMPDRNTFSYNALLSALARSASLADAEALFLSIPSPDQCSYNAIISGLAQHGHFSKSLHYFSKMHKSNFVLNEYSFSSALSACAGLANLFLGIQIHCLMSKSPLAYDVYMGGALVGMYSKCRNPVDARNVFDEMPDRNVVCWNSLITC